MSRNMECWVQCSGPALNHTYGCDLGRAMGTGRRYTAIVGIVFGGVTWPVLAQTPPAAPVDLRAEIVACEALTGAPARLACFDAIGPKMRAEATRAFEEGMARIEEATRQAEAALPQPVEGSDWKVRSERSLIDDSMNVYLTVDAEEPLTDRFGSPFTPTLIVRCAENTTAAYINFGGPFMADTGRYGVITFRIDQAPAFDRSVTESTDNRALGFWSGRSAIPFVRSLLEGDTLLLRATPYNGSPITFAVPIRGLAAVIGPLREACHW